MRRQFLRGFTVLAAAAALLGSVSITAAKSAAEYYQGKNIRFIVPYKPGGGYDAYARLLAPYFGKYTGARVDIYNLPGAGGMKGANEIFNAPADGLTIGIINGSAMVTNELAGIKGAAYKVADYNFLGRVVADQRVLTVLAKSDLKTYEDVLNSDRPVLLGATGLGGSTYVDAVIVGRVMGSNQKVIHGFNSSSDVRQALLRGDINAMWGSWGSARKGVAAGDFRIIVHDAREGTPDTQGIPSVFDFVSKLDDPEKADEILSSWYALSAVGRPVAAPPGLPAERVAFLQEAFTQAINDPEFVETAKNSNREINFLDGVSMSALAKASTNLTPEIKALFISAIQGEL